jgi:hypothetical protein
MEALTATSFPAYMSTVNLLFRKLWTLVVILIAAVLMRCAAQELPANVPRNIFPDGQVVVSTKFTSTAYEQEAFRLIIEEANKVVNDLHLPEKRPITQSNIVRRLIAPFGYSYNRKSIGNITTSNYFFGVAQGCKFSYLVVADLDSRCREGCVRYQWPASRLDTNNAYELAVSWLNSARMDVAALNRDSRVVIEPSHYWNGINAGEGFRKTSFVPIYDVYWIPHQPNPHQIGDVAMVELLAPTETLFQLNVRNPKYILRQPLVFTNLALLFANSNLPVMHRSRVAENSVPAAPEPR